MYKEFHQICRPEVAVNSYEIQGNIQRNKTSCLEGFLSVWFAHFDDLDDFCKSSSFDCFQTHGG